MNINTRVHTPMMNQYWASKNTLEKDQLLLFRLGDFYELFYEDALVSSKILGITLTKRNDIPMCGVPVHAADNYIKKLLAAGKKIAICEQTSPIQKGTLVERGIVEKLSPGTISNSVYLESNNFNFLASVCKQDNYLLFAWIDVSTADLFVERKEFSMENFRMLMGKIKPKELLYPENQEEILCIEDVEQEFSIYKSAQRDWDFSIEEGSRILKEILGVSTLKSFGLEDNNIELASIHALLKYIDESGADTLSHIKFIKKIDEHTYLEMDADAIYNLEVFSAMRGNDQFSLYGILDRCHTAFGSRLLEEWMSFPLVSKKDIVDRQEKIFILQKEELSRIQIETHLKNIFDLPRLMSKISINKAHPKDMVAISQSLEESLQVMDIISNSSNNDCRDALLDLFTDSSVSGAKSVVNLLSRALVSNPPTKFGEQDVLANGYDSTLDRLRTIKNNQQEIIDSYVQEEQSQVDFNLKLKFNNAVGYFFDIPSHYKIRCPSHFILRQALTRQDRYKTDKLIELETSILEAEQSLISYEQELFANLIAQTKVHLGSIKSMSLSIATLDVYISLANIAQLKGYVCPTISEENEIKIKNGRHPVIEENIPQGTFIANDLLLDAETQSFIMLTGPNMAGKSTYLRQNALIVLMAQIGSFVPAEEACIGIRDKIFCRVGASDNIVKGESTFLVEMSETAYILQQASQKSLVIMDEIGRGTSVTDGESIAQAVAEYFISQRIFTLFATHYHNLADLYFFNMKNYTLSIERYKGKIHFTRHIIQGASKNSYGIEVAKIAGIPKDIIVRANKLLQIHESYSNNLQSGVDVKTDNQLKLGFLEEDTHSNISDEAKNILEEIKILDINSLTPLDTIRILADYQSRLQDES